MTTPPSHWPDKALSLAVTVLVIALALHIAAWLIMSVLPVLIGIAVVVLLGFAGWSVYQFRRSRW